MSLWYLNPCEPCCWMTHPGLRGDGIGTGSVMAVPEVLQLHCPAGGPLPAYPAALGMHLLYRQNMTQFEGFGVLSNETAALWRSDSGWYHGFVSPTQPGVGLHLPLGWYTWWITTSGPLYGEAADGGPYNPLQGSWFDRTGPTVTELDDLPSHVLLLPWFP